MLGSFRGSLLLDPWGGTIPELGAFGGSLVLAPWGWTMGLVPCVRNLGLVPHSGRSVRPNRTDRFFGHFKSLVIRDPRPISQLKKPGPSKFGLG
jgi:hypothetical protein